MDFVKDNNPKYLSQVSAMIGNFPSYVKEASASERREETSDLSVSAFADKRRREFPLNTKENTYLSYAYVKAAGVEDESVLKSIESAITLHGIASDTEVIDGVFSDLEKQASKEDLSEHFALSIDYGDGVGMKYYYPVNDEFSVTKSARDLCDDFDKMPIEAFRHASKNLVKAANFLDIDVSGLPDRIRSNGVEREFNYQGAKVACRQRANLLGEQAGEVYEEIVKSASVDTENVEDYIHLFTDMDRVNDVKYSSEMFNPYEAFLSGIDSNELKKVANAYVVVSEAPIPLSEFTKKARSVIEQNFTSKEREDLLEVVKEAEENGGINASSKLLQFPTDLQKNLLGAFVND